jgi:hypothetical protein
VNNGKKKELVVTVGIGIILALVPFGYSTPVIPKWLCWGFSFLCVLYILNIVIPKLERLQVPKKIALDIAILCIGFALAWPTRAVEARKSRTN